MCLLWPLLALVMYILVVRDRVMVHVYVCAYLETRAHIGCSHFCRAHICGAHLENGAYIGGLHFSGWCICISCGADSGAQCALVHTGAHCAMVHTGAHCAQCTVGAGSHILVVDCCDTI